MWVEAPACWIPSRGETREHSRRVHVEYFVDSARHAARLAAQKYAKEVFGHGDPFTELAVRVQTAGGVFDVVVVVKAHPTFHGTVVEDDDARGKS
jgi:hypothetical protein